MRDRRKELIKQWLQEKTEKEEELLAANPASNRLEDQLKPGNASEPSTGQFFSSSLDPRT